MKYKSLYMVMAITSGLLMSAPALAASCAVIGGANSSSTSNQAPPKITTRCPVDMRRTVTADEAFPHKRENPYSMDCDLGFNMPGFDFLFGMGDINFCKIAQTIAAPASSKWNDAVSDVDKWSNWDVNLDPSKGCITGPNGIQTCTGGIDDITGGIADKVEDGLNGGGGGGGGSSGSVNDNINNATKEPTFSYEGGFPVYKPPYTNL